MNKIFFLNFVFLIFLTGCQKHTHSHHHDAPGSCKQSVNQQMYLPFHIEQKYENTTTNSNDFNLEAKAVIPKKPVVDASSKRKK